MSESTLQHTWRTLAGKWTYWAPGFETGAVLARRDAVFTVSPKMLTAFYVALTVLYVPVMHTWRTLAGKWTNWAAGVETGAELARREAVFTVSPKMLLRVCGSGSKRSSRGPSATSRGKRCATTRWAW